MLKVTVVVHLVMYGDWNFVLQESGFYLYALYNKNKPKSDELMIECGSGYFRVSTVSIWFDQRYLRCLYM